MANPPLHALVTAGGTREPIDDVRVLTNISGGSFGVAIARALAAAGVDTTIAGSREALAKLGPTDGAIQRIPFATFQDLRAVLEAAAASAAQPSLVLMAAAVADYSPIRTDGKLSSDADELVIRCSRNPKLIAMFREQFGVQTFLVGFKLLSRASRAELITRAREQIRKYRLNLVVANDLTEIRGGRRAVILITPEGGAIPIDGTTDDVAEALVTFLLRRVRVQWGRSEPIPETTTIDASRDTRSAIHRRAGVLLGFAQAAGLLPGTDGNVSYRAASLGFWVTPRQVPKATIDAADLIFVEPDLPRRLIRYRGTRKPSIDSIVQAMLYAHLPDIKGLLHFHDGIVIADAETTFPYPCGTVEEAEEVLRALDAAIRGGRYRGGPFAVRLVHHGHLIGIEPGGAERLTEEWREAEYAYRMHLGSVSRNNGRRPVILQPIFASARIIGVLARFTDLEATSCFILPSERAHGFGDEVVRQLDARGDTIVAHDDCRVVEYYTVRGYRILQRDGALVFLEPPSRRGDLGRAATVCLWNPDTRSVLLGRRTLPPYDGYYAFPGGSMDDGESVLHAALRELREETSIDLPESPPLRTYAFTVGTPDGARAWRVTNVVMETRATATPIPSTELDAAWVPIHDAPTRTPMVAHTTRRILRDLAALQAKRDESR
ncbi:NUDIX domain-containing protein [Candidatus Uhrbacteria bacterium]|nr:NUDIX domain-containing protein [Candidatus Uhrbacteria bacterium]